MIAGIPAYIRYNLALQLGLFLLWILYFNTPFHHAVHDLIELTMLFLVLAASSLLNWYWKEVGLYRNVLFFHRAEWNWVVFVGTLLLLFLVPVWIIPEVSLLWPFLFLQVLISLTIWQSKVVRNPFLQKLVRSAGFFVFPAVYVFLFLAPISPERPLPTFFYLLIGWLLALGLRKQGPPLQEARTSASSESYPASLARMWSVYVDIYTLELSFLFLFLVGLSIQLPEFVLGVLVLTLISLIVLPFSAAYKVRFLSRYSFFASSPLDLVYLAGIPFSANVLLFFLDPFYSIFFAGIFFLFFFDQGGLLLSKFGGTAVFGVLRLIHWPIYLINRLVSVLIHLAVLLVSGVRTIFLRVFWALHFVASHVVNYTIYYFRRVFLGYDDLKARGGVPREFHRKEAGLQPSTTEEKRLDIPEADIPVAIVNVHKDKYSETFVRGVLDRLGYRVLFFYGGDLPTNYDGGKCILPQTTGQSLWRRWMEHTLGFGSEFFLRKAFGGLLRDKKVKIVLAEFGPVGAKVIQVTREIGIPLVVYFHAYGLYNRNVLEVNAKQYRLLFDEVDGVIGSSREICTLLEEFGVPADRIHYLPAFVNLDMFPYSDHGKNPPDFLYVGRFSENKGPHLLILAFARVVQVVPDAKLIMVGQGGGGELFESCRMMVKAMQLESNVQFAGVLSHEEVAELMGKSRALVHPAVTAPISGDKEGTPVAVMEAMACGLPVIGTRHAGIGEIIEDGQTGFLLEEYDLEALVSKMLEIAEKEDLVRQIGLAASQAIHKHPLISRHISQLETILDRYRLPD